MKSWKWTTANAKLPAQWITHLAIGNCLAWICIGGRLCCHQKPNTSNTKIISPTTLTISTNWSHPNEVAALLPMSTNLPDLQKSWDYPNICWVPGPNGPLLQIKILYCGTIFSCVHSTCMLRHVLKKGTNSDMKN